MRDITLCQNTECPSRRLCLRQNVEPSENQSYALFQFDDKKMCEYYINMEGKCGLTNDIKKEVLKHYHESGTTKTYIEWLKDFYIYYQYELKNQNASKGD